MNIRFCDLEPAGYIAGLETGASPLSSWYGQIRERPICELDVGDICRAVRQRLFLTQILPIAFQFLREDLRAGDTYDGQLLAALAHVTPESCQALASIEEIRDYLAAQSNGSASLAPELNDDLRKLIAVLKQAN